MKNWKKKAAVLGGLVMFAALAALSLDQFRDSREILTQQPQMEEVFRSERGFGNDRFDIYGFSCASPRDLEGFQKAEDKTMEALAEARGMLEAERLEYPELTEIQKDLDRLEGEEDLQSLLVVSKDGGTKKIYLYSPNRNEGYLFVWVI